jgi:hypothetical protein
VDAQGGQRRDVGLALFGVVCEPVQVERLDAMLGKFGEVVVLDWGLAARIDRDDRARSSGEQSIVMPTIDGIKLAEGSHLTPIPLDEAVAIHNGMDGAFGGHAHIAGEPADEQLTDLSCAPMRLLIFEPNDQAFDLRGFFLVHRLKLMSIGYRHDQKIHPLQHW